MKFMLLLVWCFLDFLTAEAQIKQVKAFDESQFKQFCGAETLEFHTSALSQLGEEVRMFLAAGDYWLFFNQSIEAEVLKKDEALYNWRKEKNAFRFTVRNTGYFSIECSASQKVIVPNEMLFVVYKVYNSSVQVPLNPYLYTSVEGEKFSDAPKDKKYTVIFFIGRDSFLDSTKVKALNAIKADFGHKADFLCLSFSSAEKIKADPYFQYLKWEKIPKIPRQELTKYEIDKIIAEPSLYIIDHARKEIVYRYYHLYDLVENTKRYFNN